MVVDRHELIKGMLRLKGVNLATIARDLGVAPTTITIVSKGFRRSRRIEEALAEAVGCAPETLWPERYERKIKEGMTMET